MKKAVAIILAVCIAACAAVTAIAVKSGDGQSRTALNLKNFGKWFSYSFSIKTKNKSGIDGEVTKEDIFEKIPGVKDVHASTIIKNDDGSLLCAWFGGEKEGSEDVRIWYSKKQNGSWSEPKQIESGIDEPHWNPVFIRTADDNVRLYFKVGSTPRTWRTCSCESSDFGETWSKVTAVKASERLEAGGPVKNKCIRTADGLLLAGNSLETDDWWKAVIEYSDDDGATWNNNGFIVSKNEKAEDVDMIQPTLWQDKDGIVHALFRTKDGFIYKSESADSGKTWSEAKRTDLPNNNSGIDCVADENGNVWLVCNPSPISWFRSPLSVYVSKDNGETFEYFATLERNIFVEYSYPSIIADGNLLHICYTKGRNNIVHAEIEIKKY